MRKSILFASLLGLAACLSPARAADLQPVGNFQRVDVDGVPAWQGASELTFGAPSGSSLPAAAGPLYVQIVYLDLGQGLVHVSYPSTNGGLVASQIHTRSSRVGTGKFVSSYHELSQPLLSGSRAGGWLTVRITGGDDAPLTIRSVTVQTAPFSDPDFQTVVRRPWRQPLHFAVTDAPPRPTLKGRLMAGYQGWFRTANDRDDTGWGHWFRSKTDPSPVHYKFDMWPDTSEYPPSERVRVGQIETRGGQPAYLFSSTSEPVVRQQFFWMRQDHIDGVFLQRFLGDRKGGDDGTPEWVLLNVRKAANAEKRVWAIEYDVSGMPPAQAAEALERDWRWLKEDLEVTDDPYYARENGRPVVFVWGLAFPNRGFAPAQADQIIDFFHHDGAAGGNYVIGSLPTEWNQLAPSWLDHARKYDGLQVWMTRTYAADKQACDRWHVDYYPHVWPGFSRAHLANLGKVPDALTERAGGRFFRERIAEALAAGVDRLFVGMFDEYDEGTAIMPMSDDPPLPGPPAGRFLTNGGVAPDRWLRIAGEAEKALATASPAQTFSAEEARQ